MRSAFTSASSRQRHGHRAAPARPPARPRPLPHRQLAAAWVFLDSAPRRCIPVVSATPGYQHHQTTPAPVLLHERLVHKATSSVHPPFRQLTPNAGKAAAAVICCSRSLSDSDLEMILPPTPFLTLVSHLSPLSPCWACSSSTVADACLHPIAAASGLPPQPPPKLPGPGRQPARVTLTTRSFPATETVHRASAAHLPQASPGGPLADPGQGNSDARGKARWARSVYRCKEGKVLERPNSSYSITKF